MPTRFLLPSLTLVLFTLIACSPQPPTCTPPPAEYGEYPTNYQQIIETYYDGLLSQFASASFQWIEPPYRGHIYYS